MEVKIKMEDMLLPDTSTCLGPGIEPASLERVSSLQGGEAARSFGALVGGVLSVTTSKSSWHGSATGLLLLRQPVAAAMVFACPAHPSAEAWKDRKDFPSGLRENSGITEGSVTCRTVYRAQEQDVMIVLDWEHAIGRNLVAEHVHLSISNLVG